MKNVKKKPLYWLGVAGILIGFILGMLIVTGILPFTKPFQAVAEAFSFFGAVLVGLGYSRSRTSRLLWIAFAALLFGFLMASYYTRSHDILPLTASIAAFSAAAAFSIAAVLLRKLNYPK